MPRGGARLLVLCSSIVLALLAGHDATHILDDGLQTRLDQLAIVAVPQWLVLAIVMGVILRGERGKSQTSALLLGISVTVGFVVVHLLPLSPAAFWGLRPSGVSWVLAWMSVVSGVLLVVLAWRQRRAAHEAQSG